MNEDLRPVSVESPGNDGFRYERVSTPANEVARVVKPQKDVFVGSRTHELRVFTGSAEDAREFAAGLVEQLRDQGPVSRNPYVPMPTQWTPENWREAKNGSAHRFRQGITSRAWFGPAGLEVRIEDVS